MRTLQIVALVLLGLALSMVVSVPSWAASCWPGAVRVTDPVGAKLKAKFPPSQYGMISLLHLAPTDEAISIVDSCRRAGGMSAVGNYQASRVKTDQRPLKVVLIFTGREIHLNVDDEFFIHNELSGEIRRVPGPDNVRQGRAEFVVTIDRFESFIYPRHFAPPGTSQFSMTTYPVRGKLGRLTLTLDSRDNLRRSRPGVLRHYRFIVAFMRDRDDRAKR